jgi:SpoVK/Ycf46/Vps4 family AAA+-type ATPase
MARADLLCDVIKSGLSGDLLTLRKAAEAISAEERAKHHEILAQKIEGLLKTTHPAAAANRDGNESRPAFLPRDRMAASLFFEKNPEKTLGQLILSDSIIKSCHELVEEQMRSELLHSYGVDPRNKILLIGPPGNGKTSLAEALASELMVPLYIVKYENIVGSYLGETASRLARLFEYARTRHCVLFFDEFETLGKERGDEHETGEIKRVVSSLLLQIDALPSYVVIIAATNHDNLLDTAVWRRFQLKMELPRPSANDLELWLFQFEKHNKFKFDVGINSMAKMLVGKSYAEAEEFALSVYRQYILHQPNANMKNITENQLKIFFSDAIKTTDDDDQGKRKHA